MSRISPSAFDVQLSEPSRGSSKKVVEDNVCCLERRPENVEERRKACREAGGVLFILGVFPGGHVSLGCFLQQGVLHVDIRDIGEGLEGTEVAVPLLVCRLRRLNDVSQGCVGVGTVRVRPGHIQRLGASPAA